MIKNNIKEIREYRSVSQHQLACRINIAEDMIPKIECGEVVLSDKLLLKIANALGSSIPELVEIKNEPSLEIVTLKDVCVISLSKRRSPKLYNYLSTQHDIYIIDDVDNKFIDLLESELIKIKDIDLQNEIENAINSTVCPICGRRVDNGLRRDYRNNGGVLGTVINCADCNYIDDSLFWDLYSTNNSTEKYIKFFNNYNIKMVV